MVSSLLKIDKSYLIIVNYVSMVNHAEVKVASPQLLSLRSVTRTKKSLCRIIPEQDSVQGFVGLATVKSKFRRS